jgi:hypothetical protein
MKMVTKKKPDAKVPAAIARSCKPETIAQMALDPSVNGSAVVSAYQANIVGSDVDRGLVMAGLDYASEMVNAGDLKSLEAMLVCQATALQSIFTSLAKKAQVQQQLHHFDSILGLALKAQAQSRATISELVDLKYPRQATFVKQANIAQGPQQINNGDAAPARMEQIEGPQIKLLDGNNNGSPKLDIRAKTATARGNPAMEAVGKVHRAAKPRR